MMIREPSVAGTFYPANKDECSDELSTCIEKARERSADSLDQNIPERIIGCVMPHAGWRFSGATGARSLLAVADRHQPDTVIVFGAIHVTHGSAPTIFERGAWETPLGLSYIDDRLSDRLLGQTGVLRADAHAHEGEHSIEVELPFIQRLLPDAMIVPIMVQPHDNAVTLGRAVGRACRSYGVKPLFICSTDLTHYGPSFGFTPRGVDAEGLQWAKEVNDRRMIELMLSLDGERAVEEAIKNRNACGGGAIAATLEACKAFGAKKATLLEHTTSNEVCSEIGMEPSADSVGYASLVLG